MFPSVWTFFCYLPGSDSSFDSIMVREHTQYDFNSFKFVEICFMVQNMVYLDIWLWALEKNMYSAVVG